MIDQMTETKETTIEWPNAVGMVGLALAIVGMSDLPLAVSLLFFLASAICFPFSFSLQTSWPPWLRLALSITAVALLVFMGWSAYKKDTAPLPKMSAAPTSHPVTQSCFDSKRSAIQTQTEIRKNGRPETISMLRRPADAKARRTR